MNSLERELLLPKTAALVKPVSLRYQRTRKWKEQATGYLFLAPSLVLFAIFLFYPFLESMYLSLHITDPRGRVAAFVGLDNFTELFTDGHFFASLKVTALFALYSVPACILCAVLLAALTHGKLPGMKLFRFFFSLPIAISVGTSAVIWVLLFHPTIGMFNFFLSRVGISSIYWLSDPAWALLSVSLMTVWANLGFNYIVLSGGMSSISEEIYDSAKIDGSGAVRTFFRITLPLLSPTLFFLTIVSMIGALQSFGQIHIMTKGGPTHTTDVVVYSIYQEAFVNFHFGSGSARALVLFLLILLFTLLQFKLLERKVHYQ